MVTAPNAKSLSVTSVTILAFPVFFPVIADGHAETGSLVAT